MASSREKTKGRRESGRFAGIPHRVMATDKYISIDTHAKTLLYEMAYQYNGHNNGDLSASWTLMKKRGFKSPSTLNQAIKQLRDFGFIEITRMGGRNTCTLFALTWAAIDDCNGKLDVNETRTPSGLWKNEN